MEWQRTCAVILDLRVCDMHAFRRTQAGDFLFSTQKIKHGLVYKQSRESCNLKSSVVQPISLRLPLILKAKWARGCSSSPRHAPTGMRFPLRLPARLQHKQRAVRRDFFLPFGAVTQKETFK